MASFYKNKNFGGSAFNYSSRINNLGTNNNSFSSIKLTSNRYIIIYDGLNLTGNSMVIMDDIPDLSLYGFDKKIRSIVFYNTISPSVVYANSYDACSSFNAIDANDNIYSCSGFFVTPTGYMVTAAHCVLSDIFNETTQRYDPCVEFHVSVSNVNKINGLNKVFQARLVGYDQMCDIALLKIDGLSNQQFLSWGKSRQTPIGSRVFVLGNPAGVDEDSFVSGIVRDNKYNGEFPSFYVESVLTDSTIIGGNSGGPLLNSIGQVIALTNYGMGDSNQLGGGVAQYIAQDIVNQMIAYDLAGRPIRTDFVASNNILTIPTSSNHKFILNDGSRIYGALGATLIQIPRYLVSYFVINNNIYRGGFVTNIDLNSNLANYIDIYDIIVSIDNQEIGLFKNQITPSSVLVNKSPSETVSIQYYKYNEGFSILHTQTIILTRYSNSANFMDDVMRKNEEYKIIFNKILSEFKNKKNNVFNI
jgi:S1-C subfamily serine protease